MGVVTAGESVEEQNGVALSGVQLAISLVGKLDAGQGLAGVEGEIAQGEDVRADGLAHGGGTRKKTGLCRLRSSLCQLSPTKSWG